MKTREIERFRLKLEAFLADEVLPMGRKERGQHAEEYVRCPAIISGKIGPNLRRSGYVSVRIRGVSEEPLYIILGNKGVTFRDASHIWGKNTRDSHCRHF